jgi:hypothetical protein
MTKKTIIVLGWSLIAVIFVGFFAVMLIATFSGEAVTSVKVVPGGRGGHWFPVAVLPVLVALLIVLGFWLRRVLRRRAPGSSLNKALNQDAR